MTNEPNNDIGASSSPSADRVAPMDVRQIGTAFFMVLLFFGVHTRISIVPDGHLLVPYVVAFLASIGVLYVNIEKITDSHIRVLTQFALVVFVIAAMTSIENGRAIDHFRASTMFIYNVIIGYATYIGLRAMEPRLIERTFFWVSVVLIVGAQLELNVPMIKSITEAIREAIPTGATYSSADASIVRDLSLYGGVRPNFLASEPSVLGLMTGMAICWWLSAKQNPDVLHFIAAAALTGIGFVTIRSPNVLIGVAAYVLTALVSSRSGLLSSKFVRYGVPGIILAVIFIAPAIILYLVLTDPNIPTYMKQGSFLTRVVGPFFVARQVLMTYPLFGIGMGVDDILTSMSLNVLLNLGIGALLPMPILMDMAENVCNVLWTTWMLWGTVGFAMMFWAIGRILRTLGSTVPLFIVFCIVGSTYWQGFGGLNMPMGWITFFSVAALGTIRMTQFGNPPQQAPEEDRSQAEPTPQ